MLFNIASSYRAPIYKIIDDTYDCKWMFGINTQDIKSMDTSILKSVREVPNKSVIGPLYRQVGAYTEAKKDYYDSLFMLGEPFCLSTWAIMLRNKISKRPKRVYLWSHGWYGREGFIKIWLKRVFFGLADHVFTYGQYAKDVAISQGFNSSKITPIHNSLNHSNQVDLRSKLSPSAIYREHFGNSYPTLLFIGRLTSVKRLDMLINAIDILKHRGEHYNLVLVGDGVMRPQLEQLVNDKDLNRQVWFYGACYDDTQNAQLIFDADLCVAPGNVGLTAMHTMVFGTPVLTHDNFAMQMPEFEAVKSGETGDFFRYNDIESLASKIGEWMKTKASKREEIREACFKEIDEKWTPEFQIKVLRNYIK